MSGDADGRSGLHFGVGQVAAVQPDGAPSCSSPQTAARSLQRLPHLGVRLRATLHSGVQGFHVGVDQKPETLFIWLCGPD